MKKIILTLFILNFTFCISSSQPGSLDNSVGIGGIVISDFGSSWDIGNSVAIQSDGKILVSGQTPNAGFTTFNFALVRYNIDGSLDNSFGINGKVFTDFQNSDDFGFDIAIQNNGKILQSGYNNGQLALVRFNSNGSLDSTFDSDGKVIGKIRVGFSVIIQNNDKILAGGYSYSNTYLAFAIVRYNFDGTLDSAFGSNGIVVTDFGSNDNNAITSLAIQNDGKIIRVGYNNNDGDNNFAILRYNGDVTGIKTGSVQNIKVNIYPNPFTHSITIEIQNADFRIKNLELKIYDLLGREVHHQALSTRHEILNLNLPSGIYFYQVINDQQPVARGKLVVSR